MSDFEWFQGRSLDERMARCYWRRVGGVVTAAIIFFVILALAGCASNRYLTEEQDAAVRERCQQYGCEVIPTPIWEHVKHLLQKCAAI